MNNDKGKTEVLWEALVTGNLGKAITNQEKRGQIEFARSETLPIKCPRELLEKLGVQFGKEVDDLFIEAKLPDGWKIERTDHSMWTTLVDDKGRKRGGIFYKAAYYDRSAHMHLNCRYSYGCAPVTGWGEGYQQDTPFWGTVTDQDKVIWHTEDTATNKDYDKRDRLEKLAKEHVNVNYPNHRDPLAYWE